MGKRIAIKVSLGLSLFSIGLVSAGLGGCVFDDAFGQAQSGQALSGGAGAQNGERDAAPAGVLPHLLCRRAGQGRRSAPSLHRLHDGAERQPHPGRRALTTGRARPGTVAARSTDPAAGTLPDAPD